jgi:hypothetical protein
MTDHSDARSSDPVAIYVTFRNTCSAYLLPAHPLHDGPCRMCVHGVAHADTHTSHDHTVRTHHTRGSRN